MDINEFLPALSIFIHCFQRIIDLYVTPFTNCEFCENCFSEGRTLFKGVNTVVLVAAFLTQFGRNPIKKMCTELYSVILNFVKIIYLGA
jgi:hypothetical protein